jgi:uncharacterized protein (DUF305 family)
MRVVVPVRRHGVPLVLPVAAALAVAAAAGCSDPEPVAPSTTYTASAPVIQPGRPGEPATTVAPGGTATRAPRPGFNAADVAFVRDMIVHHGQALELAGLAPDRAADARVLALASRISAGQRPEIDVLREWLTSRRQLLVDPKHAGSGVHAMPGMATPAQVEQLAGTRGTDFDRRFLTLMVEHHRGAVTMAGRVMTTGTDLAVQELATEISGSQSAEIGRMQDVAQTLG